MNEELSKAITELVGSVVDAKDFLVAELPEYVYQLLMWHGVYNFSMFLLGIVLLFGLVYSNYRLFKWLQTPDGEDWYNHSGELLIPIGFTSTICLAFPMCLINLTWLQIWIAPKVWLVDYAMSLVK